MRYWYVPEFSILSRAIYGGLFYRIIRACIAAGGRLEDEITKMPFDVETFRPVPV